MSFNPPKAFHTAFIDFWNLTEAYKMNGMSHTSYMQSVKQSYQTMNSIMTMTFWSIINQVRDRIPEDVFDEYMRKIADEENGYDGRTPEERFQRMVELIENTMLDIDPDHIGEMYGE